MPRNPTTESIATLGIDIGKNVFHLIGLDKRGAIVLRQKLSRSQIEVRLANLPICLIGMEACVGAHHLGRQLREMGHDVRLMPANYVRPYSKGQKNDFRDAEAIAEAVQRPTMKFVAIKSVDQLDLQALHRVRERLVSQRTGVINQIRAFVLERSIAVRQGAAALRMALPRILAATEKLSPRMIQIVQCLADDWRHLDQRIKAASSEIETIAKSNADCERLMTVPGIGPIVSTRRPPNGYTASSSSSRSPTSSPGSPGVSFVAGATSRSTRSCLRPNRSEGGIVLAVIKAKARGRRPALTTAPRAAVGTAQVGAKERSPDRTKELRRKRRNAM